MTAATEMIMRMLRKEMAGWILERDLTRYAYCNNHPYPRDAKPVVSPDPTCSLLALNCTHKSSTRRYG